MSTPGAQRYSRIMLTLMNGGTKLTRRLVEKRVKDLSKNGEEDTIDEFLLKNKAVLQKKLGKNKANVFFPPSGHTSLDYWDLCKLCVILEETCDLSDDIKMRIQNLINIRNKLCHLNDPTLDTTKFDTYTKQLDVDFEKCLEEINDEKFTEEMNALVQSLATDPLSIEDTLKTIHNLYRSEWTQKKVLEKIGNGQDLTNRMIETLIEKVERLESRFPSGSSVDITGIGMGMEVENCSAEEEKELLDSLEKYFNEIIEQKVCPEEDLPNGVMHTVRESVRQVFQDFLRRGRQITIVKQKCLLLTIKCASVKSFLDMIRDYRTGDLSLQLSGIETALKNLQGCGNVQLVNFIFKEEFIEVMDDLVSKLCKRVQETEHTAVQTSSNAENSIRVTLKFPTISERETVQNRFETKLSVDEMNRIESDLRRMLNEERMSLTDKLVVKDDTVSSFAQQSDTSVVDENTTVEEETQTRQSRRGAALYEEEDTSTPSLIRDSQLTFDESTARGKGTQILFHGNNGDRQTIKAGNILVGSIDFGTTYSGWAVMFSDEFKSEPTKGFVKQWHSGSSIITDKTPTVVLIQPGGNKLEAFGYDAENRYKDLIAQEEHEGYYYFRRFKMKLHKQLGGKNDLNMKLTDEMGHTLPAIDVFAMAIEYLVNDMHDVIKDRISGVIKKSEVHWVITVPAIWTDFAKQFMRKAGEQAGIDDSKLSIALEPEAASIFCRHLSVEKRIDTTNFCIASIPARTRYMVLDAGGGTIDITVHEIQANGAVKEIQAASGGGWGGTLVDQAFEKLIIDLVGESVYQDFKQESPDDWLDFWRDFELKKRTIKPDNETKVVMRIPETLRMQYESKFRRNFKEAVESSSYAENIAFVAGKMKFDAIVFKRFFDVSLTKTIQHTKNLIRDPAVRDIKAILMVGGFSESPMLQDKVKSCFRGIDVIIPAEASSSILRGALIFGHSPTSISERVLRYSYGVSGYKAFIKGEHPESKCEVTDQGLRCRDIFDKHVEKNQKVKEGEPQITKIYLPVNRDQKGIDFPIFASEMKDPKYTDVGCQFIGEIQIDFPDHDGDLSRKVEVCLTFSGTEIEVTAQDVKTGKLVKAYIDFLS